MNSIILRSLDFQDSRYGRNAIALEKLIICSINRVSLKINTTIFDATPIETRFLPSPNAECNEELFGFSRLGRKRVSGFCHTNCRFCVGRNPLSGIFSYSLL
ncbi:hypothetical protein [Brunnivagina elsteri]|uniref:hypothetical protein n=1 Tax=Brunnivagina elsteri TaxID=1247191 RepID=UPI001178864D|nr:hypothetical protein [Calothrix elsteri]